MDKNNITETTIEAHNSYSMPAAKFVVMVTLFVLALGEEPANEFATVHPLELLEEYADDDCITELNLKDENGAFKKDSPNATCYFRCVHLNAGLVDDFGEPILDEYRASLRPLVSGCNEKTKTEPQCERELSFMECYVREEMGYYKQTSEECASQTDTEISSTEKTGVIIFDGDHRKACYNRCIMKKEGLVGSDDGINVNDFRKMGETLNVANVDEAISKCNAKNMQDDKCIMVVQVVDCVVSKLLDGGFDEPEEYEYEVTNSTEDLN